MERAEKVVGGNKATLLRSIYKSARLKSRCFFLIFKPHNIKMRKTSHLIDARTKCVFDQGQRENNILFTDTVH